MMSLLLLGYVPLLDPIPEGATPPWWLVMILLTVLISMAYKAIKLPKLADLPRQTLVMSVQIIAFMVVAAALIWLLTEVA